MNRTITEDPDVPALAVRGLTEATRNARRTGEIVVVRAGDLLRIAGGTTVEVMGKAPGRKKVSVRTKKIKR